MPITIGSDDIFRRNGQEQAGTSAISLPSVRNSGRGYLTNPLTPQQILDEAARPDTTSVDLGNYGKIEVTQPEFDIITSTLSQIKDKSQAEAMEIRMATALSFSRNLDIPFSAALANLDTIAKEWNGMEYRPTATNYRSILNSFSAGKLSYQRGELGNRLKNTSDEAERQALLQQAVQMDAELQGLQDDIPRPWYVDIMRSTGETAFFSLTGIASNALGGGVVKGALAGLGALGFALSPGLATAIVAGGATLGGFVNSASVEGGNSYIDMLLNGVEEPVARVVSDFYGAFAGAVEVGLDAFLGPVSKLLGAPAKNITSKIMSRMLRSGTLGEVGTFAVRYVGGGVSEGMEELIQQIGQNLASDIAYAVSETSDVEPDWNVLEGAVDSFVGGFFGSLLLGLPFTAADVRVDFDTAAAIRRDAAAHRSKEEFLETWRDHPVGGMSTEAWEQHLSDMYDERTKEVLAETEEMIRQDYGSMREASDAESDTDIDEGEDRTDAMPVSRRKDGSLYSRETRRSRSVDGNDFHTLDFASAENPRERYGHVTYRTSQDGTLTIVDVGTQRGYDGLRREMVSDLIMRHPDMDIRWETRTAEETELRDSLMNANPRGREFGLNWTRRNDDDYAKVKARIGTAFSDDDAVNSGFAAVVQLLGEKNGMTGSEWLDSHIAEIRKWTAEEQAAADARLDPEDIARGRHALGATTFAEIGDGIRATIYAGRNANPTTFIHELTHVIRKTSGAGEEFRTLFEERLKSDGRFRSFVESNDIIKHKDFNRLFQSDEWTIYDEEFFAELAEAYFQSGHTGSQRVNSLFRRIQDWFRSVYNAIRRTGELNEEVTSYFDRVFGFGEEANAERMANETEARTASEAGASEESDTRTDASEDASEGGDTEADAPSDAEDSAEPSRPRTKGEWNKRAFMDEISDVSSPEAAAIIYDGVPVRLLRNAGLVRSDLSGRYGLDSDAFMLDPRFEGMSIVDAERMAENARRYQALRESGQDVSPSMLWEGISTNDGRSISELFQTGIGDDIAMTDEWRDTEAALREDAANFDFAGRHLAPNGQLSILPYREWVTVRTPSFMAWFGDWPNDPENASKAVDYNGEPIVVYHGSPNEFTAFDPEMIGTRWLADDMGFFFSSSRSLAEESYADNGGYLYPVFLNLRNPLIANDAWSRRFYGRDVYWSDDDAISLWDSNQQDIISAMKPENDGVIVHGARRYPDMYVALRPEQIKSIDNRGTFDSGSPDIYYQTGGYDRDRSMSNRAVEAYEDGEAPLSKWTRNLFTEVLSGYNSPEVADILSAIPVSVLKDIALVRSSWHHTGIFYNPTDFYSLSSLFTGLSEDQAREIVASYQRYKEESKDFKERYEQVIKDGHAMVTYRPDGENPVTVSADIAPDGTFEADSIQTDGTVRKARTGILGSDRFSAYYGAVTEGLERMPIKADIIPSSIRRSNGVLYQLSPEYVRENMDYETRMPTDEAFLDAVRNTPGASIADDGIIVDLERWQRPEQDNEASVRTGVFYLPRGASQSRYYRGGTGFYGGPVHLTGETLLKAPLVVKGATGGNVPLKAYEALFGKEAAKKLEEDCESIMQPYQRSAKANRAMDVYYEYLPYADDDYMDFSTLEINSRDGNQLRYAVQESIVAHAVREAGYDSVVGFNRGKLTEIFDVREGNYPSETSDVPWAVYAPESQTLHQVSLGDDPVSAMETDLRMMSDSFPTYEQFEEYVETAYAGSGISERDIEAVWNRFKGDEGEPTLESPRLSGLDEAGRDTEFTRLTGEKAGYDAFISALRNAMSSNDANMASVRADIERNVPPLLRNILANEEEAGEHAADTIRGYINADPSFYRDLYGRASGNADWLVAYTLNDIPAEIADDGEGTGNLDERRRIASDIEDEALRRAVLSGEDTLTSEAYERQIADKDRKIAEIEKSIQDIRDEESRTAAALGDSNKEALRNWRKADREIARVRKRISTLSERIANDSRRNIPRREGQELVSDRLVDEQASLVRQLNQLIRQRDSYLRAIKNQAAKERVDRQRQADAERTTARLSALRERYEERIADLRNAYREREGLRNIRAYKDRLAAQIMRSPSANVAIDERRKILAIQAMIDPASRSYVTLGGERFDIDTAKAMFRDTPDDPRFAALRPDYIDRLTKKSLGEFTIAELEAIRDAVNELRKEGLRKRSAYVDAQRAEVRRLQNELMATLMHSPRYTDAPLHGTGEERKREGGFTDRVFRAKLATINMARKAQILDNDTKGAFYGLLSREKRRMQDAERRAIGARMNPIIRKVHELGVKDDLYREHTVMVDGRDFTYTFSQLAYVYLSQLNPKNRDAMAYGTLVTEAERQGAKDRAARLSYTGTRSQQRAARREQANEYIREIGDRRYSDLLAAATRVMTDPANAKAFEIVKMVEEDFNGPAFDRVVRIMNDVYNIEVTREGYYLPIDREGFVGESVADKYKDEVLSTVPGFRGYVQKGFTNDRMVISPQEQSAIGFDLFRLWQDSVTEQEHMIAATEYVRKLNGVFKVRGSQALREAITNTYGKRMMEDIDLYIQEVANPNAFKEKDSAADAVNLIRGNIYSAYLGLRLSSIVTQLITSPGPFLARVNALELGAAYGDMVLHYGDVIAEVNRLSSFMESRSFDYTAEIIQDQLRQLDQPRHRRMLASYQELALSGVKLADRITVYGGWLAVYKKEYARLSAEDNTLTSSEIERRAAAEADEFVQETQPQGDRTEMSPLFTSRNAFARIFLQFQSALNVQWQQIIYDIPQAFRHGEWRKGMGQAMGIMLAGAIYSLVRNGFEDDDDEKTAGRARRWLYWMLSQGAQSVPLISSYADTALEYLVTGDSTDFFGASINAFPGLDKANDAIKAVTDGDWLRALDRAAESTMLFTGLPYSLKSDIEALFGIDSIFDFPSYREAELNPASLVGRRD